MIYDDDIQDKLKEIDEHIKNEYIATHPKQERDWRTYEQQFSKRIKEAMSSLDPLTHEAVSTMKIEPKPGRHDAQFAAEDETPFDKTTEAYPTRAGQF